MSKVTFRSKQPYFQLSYMDVFRVGFITVPVVGGKPYKDNGKPNIDYAKCEELGIKDPDSVGSGYLFIEGADHNQISLTDPEDIIRVRERIANDPDYIEISCNDEARMLGAGFSKPVGGRDHAKHIEELKRKYGGDEEPEYSEWDRSLISKIKQ